MVTYMDGVIGDMVGALKAKNMWDNLLWFHQSDNGGPSFSGSSHTANNFPQKGSKMTNCEPRDCCWHLGCILPRVPAMIVRAGRVDL